MKIAVIGAGNVGATLGRRWAEAGHEVVFGVRDGGEVRDGLPGGTRSASVAVAARDAEVVVLAVPFMAVPEALSSAGSLEGKIVIDATNPVGREGDTLVVDASHGHASGGERTAALAPGARVVKALNTVGFNIMADPRLGGSAAVLPIAGDDSGANQTVARLVEQLGFESLDAGPLLRSRELEHWAILWISLAFGGMGREFAFSLVRRQG